MSTQQLHWPESPLQEIHHPLLEQKKLSLFVKRDDLLHPHIAGNKWRKLKYNLLEMQKQKKNAFLTFSGAFSNHLYAASMASRLLSIQGNAIIRGPHLDRNNPTIKMANACQMNLHVVDRATYRLRHQQNYLDSLQAQFPHCYFIPEGGSNQAALIGVEELANSLPDTDYVVCAVGSGGTLAGLIKGCSIDTQLIGIPVLKQGHYLKEEVARLFPKATQQTNWQLRCDFHDGGYGKFSKALWQFCKVMKQQCHLPLEPVYTGKMFYALWQLMEADFFEPNSHIIAIHTGGLQGLDGLRYRQLIPD